jgi:hypothetical protein
LDFIGGFATRLVMARAKRPTEMRINDEMRRIAAKVIWWQTPAVALANPERFLAQVMTLGTWREVRAMKEALGWNAFREVLEKAPPGVFDARSWNYWHGFFGLPAPGMPQRSLT